MSCRCTVTGGWHHSFGLSNPIFPKAHHGHSRTNHHGIRHHCCWQCCTSRNHCEGDAPCCIHVHRSLWVFELFESARPHKSEIKLSTWMAISEAKNSVPFLRPRDAPNSWDVWLQPPAASPQCSEGLDYFYTRRQRTKKTGVYDMQKACLLLWQAQQGQPLRSPEIPWAMSLAPKMRR